MKALVLNAVGSGFDLEDVDIAAPIGKDLERARRVASQIRSGRVVINGMMDNPDAPWGGFKLSGVGVETRAILES
jgi:acyl-CoA reductase-like NAD-dependent aldehyde dehydrogenase